MTSDIPDSKSDKPKLTIWNNSIPQLRQCLVDNENWVMDQDVRFRAMIETATAVSRHMVVVSTATQARQIKARQAEVYTYEDPAPVAIPSAAMRVALAELPVWALGSGGAAAHLPADDIGDDPAGDDLV